MKRNHRWKAWWVLPAALAAALAVPVAATAGEELPTSVGKGEGLDEVSLRQAVHAGVVGHPRGELPDQE